LTVAGLDRAGPSADPARKFDTYTDGARTRQVDPFTDGALTIAGMDTRGVSGTPGRTLEANCVGSRV
jgi:hypothetical protein